MSTLNLVSTIKFTNAKGNNAKYEIYHDMETNDYQAEVSYLTDVISTEGFVAKVWYKTQNTIHRLSGNTIADLEGACKKHFSGK